MTARFLEHFLGNQIEPPLCILPNDAKSIFGRIHFEAFEVDSHDVQDFVHNQVDVPAMVPVGQFDSYRVHGDVACNWSFGGFFFLLLLLLHIYE